MDKDAAFMKAINDVITAIEGIQETLGKTIERVIKLEERVEHIEQHGCDFAKKILKGGLTNAKEENSTSEVEG